MGITDSDVFTLAFDDPVAFPCAERAADGVQRRARHLGYVQP